MKFTKPAAERTERLCEAVTVSEAILAEVEVLESLVQDEGVAQRLEALRVELVPH